MASRPASSAGGRPSGQERKYYQDFITRIRYQNHLPAPPQPPKLLEIPNNAAIEYTSANFASRLVREQPLNIEVDSELGMPLDLLPFGPEVFSPNLTAAHNALRAGEPPKVHPHDQLLLRPISALGKPSHAKAGVSFLRRTEYISNEGSRSTFQSTTSRELIDNITKHARKTIKNPINDPVAMLQAVIRGFDVANPPSGKPWALPKHPTKANLRAVDSWPVLPDLAAHPDGLGYVIVKLSTNPVAASTSRDPGLDFALLRPWNDEGAPEDSKFHYYLPDGEGAATAVKRKYDAVDASEADYTHTSVEGRKFYRFKRLRAYEYVVPPEVMKDTYREVALVMRKEDKEGAERGEDGKQKAAYFSPIFQRNILRPMRTRDVDDSEANKADIAEVKFRELLPEESDRIQEQVVLLTEGE
ncbi:hypothetical protein DRE_03870 [Drechslerella stenobrocha 248]|uniref:Paf1-domain-containing protein n=1 Tax=Drechslerella stenobrocha 248 TaxID=1043628 RepID=W7I3R1_9PEZI|nr:hypothetical protein DRE_03870 [Drechslerella stenobrocha 248]